MNATASLQERPSAFGVWWAAIRPATLTAALGPVAVGGALAHREGRFAAGALAGALLGAMFIQIGTNLHNDYEDFRKGADTDARLGPARATQRGWLTPAQVKRGAIVSFALATVCGVYLTWIAGPAIVGIGLASLLAAVLYTGGPAPLAYHGLGDLFVMLFFGQVATVGAYFCHAGRVSNAAALASVAIGAMATAILVVNNLRDRHTDAEAGKRTLAVRFGARFARLELTALVVIAYAVCAALALTVARGAWLSLLSLPLAVAQVVAVWRTDGAALNPHLGGVARAGLVQALLLAVGLALPWGAP